MSRNLSLSQLAQLNALLSQGWSVSENATFALTRATTAFNPFDGTTAANNVRRRARIPIAPGWNPLGDFTELASTNRWLWSDDLSNAATTKTDLTVTANAFPSYDGTSMTAAKVEVATATAPSFEQSFTGLTAGRGHAVAIYIAKGFTLPFLKFEITSDAGANGCKRWLNLSTMKFGAAVTMGTGGAQNNALVIEERNYFRVIFMTTVDSAATAIRIRCALTSADAVDTPANVGQYCYIGGIQYEMGWGAPAFHRTSVTSHIVTGAASVTRNQDGFGNLTGIPGYVSGKSAGSIVAFVQDIYSGQYLNAGMNGALQIGTQFQNAGIISWSDLSVGFVNGSAANVQYLQSQTAPNMLAANFWTPRKVNCVGMAWAKNDFRGYVNGLMVGVSGNGVPVTSTADVFQDLSTCTQSNGLTGVVTGRLCAAFMFPRALTASEFSLLAKGCGA